MSQSVKLVWCLVACDTHPFCKCVNVRHSPVTEGYTYVQFSFSQAGTTAFLECGVELVTNRSVSWVRRRDRHILAVDEEVFIPDTRFQVTHVGNKWTLVIREVGVTDEGSYQCQVSSVNR